MSMDGTPAVDMDANDFNSKGKDVIKDLPDFRGDAGASGVNANYVQSMNDIREMLDSVHHDLKDEETVYCRSVRKKNITEKSLHVMMDAKEERLKSILKSLTVKSENIDTCMNDVMNAEHVQLLFVHFVYMYDELTSIYDDICMLCYDEERLSSIQSWFEQKTKYLIEFKHNVGIWLSATKVHDSVPFKSRSRSSVSIRSNESVISAKLKEEQRSAEIAARKEALHKKQQLEQARLKIKQEEEELAVATELAVSKAKSRVLSQFDESHAEMPDDVLTHHTFRSGMNLGDQKRSSFLDKSPEIFPQRPAAEFDFDERLYADNITRRNGLNRVVTFDAQQPFQRRTPHREEPERLSFQSKTSPKYDTKAATFYPSRSHHGQESKRETSDGNFAVESALLAVARHLRKPNSDITKFSGDPMTYNRFIRQFNTQVVPNTEDDDERLNFLEQFTSGEAYQIVRSYAFLDAEVGYPSALTELAERYGDPEIIATAFIQKALKWPSIRPNDSKSLDHFSIFLSECEHAVHSIDSIKILEYPDNMKRLVHKLPYFMQSRWRDVVQKAFMQIKFHDLAAFVKRESKKANHPVYGINAMSFDCSETIKKTSSSGFKATPSARGSFAGVATTSNVKSVVSSDHMATSEVFKGTPASNVNALQIPCCYCAGNSHCLETCKQFSSLPFKGRIVFLQSKGLCFGCLKLGHFKVNCKNKATCLECRGRHPTVLHIHRYIPVESNHGVPVGPNIQSHMGAGSGDCTFAIVPVKIRLKNSCSSINTYAFLDNGSNVSFCSERLMSQLGATGRKEKIKIDTMGFQHTMITYSLNDLVLSDLAGQHAIVLEKVYTKNSIPATKDHIPLQADIEKWSHLSGINLQQIDSGIDLLIGSNIADAFTPLEVRTGPRVSPYAARTLIGWVIWNLVRDSDRSALSVNRVQVSAVEQLVSDRRLDQMFQKYLNIDFPERVIDDRKEDSVEDIQFRKKIENSLRLVDGHYQMGLPFRDGIMLPNNHSQALKRLWSLKKKLQRHPEFMKDYVKFMNEVLDKNYAEPVPAHEINRDDGKVWYIPHHGVYHPHKPGKIRVLFDCASTCQGVSLNQALLQGPDLTNSLVGVLVKFREQPVAVMADIESMFYKVRVQRDDIDCLRFFWWPDGDIEKEPVVYRMLVHLFGATSSPTCANFALQRTAIDWQEDFSSAICSSISENFYVDDFLKSISTVHEAIDVCHKVTDLCARGGFRLTKWSSNNRDVLRCIPVEEHAKELKALDFDKDDLPTERALGVIWLPESDEFTFNVSFRDLPATRRNILSTVSSVFDPLGFASPFILKVKILLQELCTMGITWDQPIEKQHLLRWEAWLAELPLLNKLRIHRCFKPSNFGSVSHCQIHHFADASDQGYGVASYVRLVNEKQKIHCSLLYSKARVSPLKKTTVPRLELTAATLAVRVHKFVSDQLNYKIDAVYYWTDSMAVLRYIRNVKTRFHTFVANRVSLIREGSEVDSWKFVGTKLNPADDVSRGLNVKQLLKSNFWICGPEFLQYPEKDWPVQPNGMNINEDDVEVNKKRLNLAIKTENSADLDVLLPRMFSYFSDWKKLKRFVAWILVLKRSLRYWVLQRKITDEKLVDTEPDPVIRATLVEAKMQKLKNNALLESKQKLKYVHLSTSLMEDAERALCLAEQRRLFGNDICRLQKDCSRVSSKSVLFRLDPVIIDGLLRVGGRLERASIPYESKHPVIIPATSPISKLILTDAHRSVGHLGKNSILAEVRQKFWIIRANPMIRQLVSKCVICRKYRARRLEQNMADLPLDRTVAGESPFTRTGVDYFGPFQVKRGRSNVKRYGVVFTCLSTRAIHIELASTLDTNSCINAIRRFMARRGPVKILWSDNGTNFVGSERELRVEMDRWNQSQIHNTLLQKGVDWHFNPPSGSHFGGIWERMIRSIRKILFGLLQQQSIHLDDESLYTLFCEVESILNSRPITTISNDPDDCEALTPNHLLLLGPGPRLPCGIFTKNDNYARRRWRQVQYLADVFWHRWSKEYLATLQERQKWLHPRVCASVDDIVLVMDTNPRNSWALGRVVKVHTDQKGLVRVVDVKTSTSTLCRPIHKLCLLLEADSA